MRLRMAKYCSLWKERAVRHMLDELGLEDVVFNGCALGLESQHGANTGLPILKPWRVATNMV